MLKEAELVEDGLRLGPVGGRIVGEVVVGLLQSDPAALPRVRPGLAADTAVALERGSSDMVDFLTFAGVDPKSRGQ